MGAISNLACIRAHQQAILEVRAGRWLPGRMAAQTSLRCLLQSSAVDRLPGRMPAVHRCQGIFSARPCAGRSHVVPARPAKHSRAVHAGWRGAPAARAHAARVQRRVPGGGGTRLWQLGALSTFCSVHIPCACSLRHPLRRCTSCTRSGARTVLPGPSPCCPPEQEARLSCPVPVARRCATACQTRCARWRTRRCRCWWASWLAPAPLAARPPPPAPRRGRPPTATARGRRPPAPSPTSSAATSPRRCAGLLPRHAAAHPPRPCAASRPEHGPWHARSGPCSSFTCPGQWPHRCIRHPLRPSMLAAGQPPTLQRPPHPTPPPGAGGQVGGRSRAGGAVPLAQRGAAGGGGGGAVGPGIRLQPGAGGGGPGRWGWASEPGAVVPAPGLREGRAPAEARGGPRWWGAPAGRGGTLGPCPRHPPFAVAARRAGAVPWLSQLLLFGGTGAKEAAAACLAELAAVGPAVQQQIREAGAVQLLESLQRSGGVVG